MYVFCDWFFCGCEANAHSMFGSPRSVFAVQRSVFGLYSLEPTMFPMPCSFGGIKEPFVYMHCCGLYLRVFMW